MACLYFRIHLIQGKLYLQAHKPLNTIKSRPNGYVQTCDTCKTVTEKQVKEVFRFTAGKPQMYPHGHTHALRLYLNISFDF